MSRAREDAAWSWSAVEMSRALRRGEMSCRELIRAHLDRIGEVNGPLNAVTAVLEESALRQADEVDRAARRGGQAPPLRGVPFSIKENVDLAGSPTTRGLPDYAGAVAEVDAPHVARLRAAGAIALARTNMPDLGLRWHTDSGLRGATLNPWDPSRTPGGSSGGDAVAVATGMVPVGLANDLAGSLRFPAQCCGIASIRPTYGRVPAASSLPPFDRPLITGQLFAVQGPMARRVADLRSALATMTGPDPRDPWWTPAALEGPRLARPRVVFATDPGGAGVDETVAAAVRRAAEALSREGYDVEEGVPPAVEAAARLFTGLVLAEIRTVVLPRMRPVLSDDSARFLDLLLEPRPRPDLASYMQGFSERLAIAREWSAFQQRYPLVLGPVSTRVPFPVGFDVAGVAEASAVVDSMRLTVTVNLLGLPAVAVPLESDSGMPTAVQIIAPRYREDLALDAAEAMERAVGPRLPVHPGGTSPSRTSPGDRAS